MLRREENREPLPGWRGDQFKGNALKGACVGKKLPDRLYYRLEDAAQWMTSQGSPCTAEGLLHYGGCGYLEILASVEDLYVREVEIGPDDIDGVPTVLSGWSQQAFIAIYAHWLMDIELHDVATEVVVAPQSYSRREGDFVALIDERYVDTASDGYRRDMRYCEVSKGGPIDENIGNELTLVRKNLFVRRAELHRFMGDPDSLVRADRPMPAKLRPHGNAERFAKNREAVLFAAIQVKHNFPELCGATATQWAEVIDKQALKFWPDTGEPPLQRTTIEALLQNAMRKLE